MRLTKGTKSYVESQFALRAEMYSYNNFKDWKWLYIKHHAGKHDYYSLNVSNLEPNINNLHKIWRIK